MRGQSPSEVPAPETAEHDRLRRVYDSYEADPRYLRMWGDSAAQRFMQERKWELVARDFRHRPPFPGDTRALDLGSGDKGDSAQLTRFGVSPERVVALDLIPAYARRVRRSNAGISAISGDALLLPFRSAAFRIVYQSTMLSSVIDRTVRAGILAEVARVLVPGGLFISYDVRYRNPWNPNTRPIRAGELREAFRGWSLRISSLTGIPQILRLLAPLSKRACWLVEAIPPLRSHLLAIATKPEP